MLHNSSTKFEKQNYFQNQPKFNGTYSKNNLPKIKKEAYCIALYVTDSFVIYFDSFDVEHIPKKVKEIHKKQKYHNKYL